MKIQCRKPACVCFYLTDGDLLSQNYSSSTKEYDGVNCSQQCGLHFKANPRATFLWSSAFIPQNSWLRAVSVPEAEEKSSAGDLSQRTLGKDAGYSGSCCCSGGRIDNRGPINPTVLSTTLSTCDSLNKYSLDLLVFVSPWHPIWLHTHTHPPAGLCGKKNGEWKANTACHKYENHSLLIFIGKIISAASALTPYHKYGKWPKCQ